MRSIRIATLGPEGTCHEEATRQYCAFQGVNRFEIQFVEDFLEAVDQVKRNESDFIVQGCAHPMVSAVIERDPQAVVMIDSFLYPTKELALMTRVGVETPKVLGLMPVTAGYTDISSWPTHRHERSNPIVAKKFVDGEFDSAIAFAKIAESDPERYRIVHRIGRVNMAWLVYGRDRRGSGEVLGVRDPKILTVA
jgi:hypothetical protein